MKIESKTLMVNVANDVVVGSLEFTAIHMLMVSKGKDNEISVDIDFADVENVKFMGMPVEGYDAFRTFKKRMLEMGIDIDEAMDEACVGLISSEFVSQLKADFSKIA
jgi:hypothetical protein